MTGFEGAGIHVELARRLLRWNRASQRVSSGILGYGLSVASVAMAVGAALTLQHYDFRAPPTAVFTLAIAIAAWYGGIGPAVVAVLLSITCFVYFFTAPFYSFEISAREIPYTLVFVVWAPIVAWFSLAARRIADELRQAYDRLRLEVEQRREQARLLDQTHDSIFFRDMNGVISYWNSWSARVVRMERRRSDREALSRIAEDRFSHLISGHRGGIAADRRVGRRTQAHQGRREPDHLRQPVVAAAR